MNFRSSLLDEIKRHPKAEALDFVAFCYEAAYGQKAKAEDKTAISKKGSLYERIGNGYVRLFIGPFYNEGYSAMDVERLVVLSQGQTPNSARLFCQYLSVVVHLASEGFLSRETAASVRQIVRDSPGPYAHSQTYKETYSLFYQVVSLSALKHFLQANKPISRSRVSPSMLTSCLTLRPFKEEDLISVHTWCSSPAVTKYLLWHPHRDLAVTSRLLKKWIMSPRNFCWAITKEGRAIGEVEVIKDLANKGCEIGFLLSEKEWGKGYMKEALGSVLPFLFRSAHYVYVNAEVEEDNQASLSLLRHMSFHEVRAGYSRFVGKLSRPVSFVLLRREAIP